MLTDCGIWSVVSVFVVDVDFGYEGWSLGAVIPSIECNSENLEMYTYQYTHTYVHLPRPVVGCLFCFWNWANSKTVTVAFRSFAVWEGVGGQQQSPF